MEEQLLGIIKDSLDSLDKLTIWLFTSFIVILISLFSSKDELSFGAFEINKKYAGAILYLMLCGLTFNVFKLLNNLSDAYDRLLWQSLNSETPQKALESIEKAKLIFHTHTWIFNPFAQTGSFFSGLVDNIGYPMLITIWWFGNALAQSTLTNHNILLRLFGLLCAGLYLLLGLGCMVQIGQLTAKVCDSQLKMITPFIGILVGGALFFVITFLARRRQRDKTTNIVLPKGDQM